MPKGQEVLANQPHLFELPVELDKRAAFGRVPHPNFFGIDPSALRAEISDEDILRVEPANLRRALYSDGELSFGGVAFRPDEYEAVVRSEDAFEAAIGARALKASQLDPDLERRQGKSERAKEHAFDSKVERLDGMVKGLETERTNLERFLKEMHSPGFAHMSEANLRILATSTWQLSFRNMLGIAAREFGWDTETAARAEKALTYRIASTDYRGSFAYWKEMTRLAWQYARSREKLIRINKKNIENRVK